MDELEKARCYLKKLTESRPKHFVQEVDAQSRGLQTILHYLSTCTDEVCAGDLSKQFNVSTARIAVALKKLSGKGLVETCPAADDKRRVVVKITQAGRDEVQRSTDGMLKIIAYLIREVGEQDIDEFLRIFSRINELLDRARCGQ